jgi:hypothetical protein
MILKAKYYPNGELVDTVFLVETSPTWKAIVHGLGPVKKGIIWRIGSSTKVNTWRDPWIPETTIFQNQLEEGEKPDGVSSRCSSPAGITRVEIGQRDLA